MSFIISIIFLHPTYACSHGTNDESPCSPITYACIFLLDTSKYFPIWYLNLDVSSAVPEPITLFVGNPDTSWTTLVIISTGFDAIRNIPLNPLFTICVVISFIILAFACDNSNLVCPGFWFNPAVITTISASLHSEYSPDFTTIWLGEHGIPSDKSIASPIALSFNTSINTNSFTPIPWFTIAYAILIPTNPVPTKTTFLFSIIKITFLFLYFSNKRLYHFIVFNSTIKWYNSKIFF